MRDIADQKQSYRAIRAELIAAGYVEDSHVWVPFSGGRTNRIWHVGNGPDSLVCKLFSKYGGTELFPNDDGAEAIALRALTGTGLAPELVAEYQSAEGRCLLYRHVQGEASTQDFAAIADTLSKVHAFPSPKGLRRIQSGPESILSQGDSILKKCASALASEVRGMRPSAGILESVRSVFLHGDVVPANAISTEFGAVLIDWQCPAIGDPCEDLSTFLSPAMQTLYGTGPLSSDQEQQFLASYGNALLADRLDELRAHFHWRMAAHCLWKSEQGEADYEEGLALELAALEKL